MIVRFPGRERDPGWQAEQEVQPDPMLQEHHRAGPLAIALAAAFGLLVVGVVFYGLNRGGGPITTASVSSEPTTSGQAPPSGQAPAATDANAPAPTDKANTAKHGTPQAGQSSGQAQPANQGQGAPAGKSGENR